MSGLSRLREGLVANRPSDFFTEQTITADVYYFKSIFHNWADKYCIKILQNLGNYPDLSSHWLWLLANGCL